MSGSSLVLLPTLDTAHVEILQEFKRESSDVVLGLGNPRLRPPRAQVIPACASASGSFHVRAGLCFCRMATRSRSPPLARLRVRSGGPYTAGGEPSGRDILSKPGRMAFGARNFTWGAGGKTAKMVFSKRAKWWISQRVWNGLVARYPGCLETPWQVCCFSTGFSNTFPIFSPAKQSLRRGREQEGQSTAQTSCTAQAFVSPGLWEMSFLQEVSPWQGDVSKRIRHRRWPEIKPQCCLLNMLLWSHWNWPDIQEGLGGRILFLAWLKVIWAFWTLLVRQKTTKM